MLTTMKRAIARRQRSSKVCAACGRAGTTENPLIFVVETNRFWHQPHCMPATEAAVDASPYRSSDDHHGQSGERLIPTTS